MKRSLLAVACLVVLAGCDSPSRTVDSAKKELSAFQAAPDAAKQAAVEQTLAKLDVQIDALEKKGDHTQADSFRQQAFNLRSDFQAAKVAKALKDATKAIQGIGEAFKEAGKTFSDTFKNTNNP
jgi:hypothetical protein